MNRLLTLSLLSLCAAPAAHAATIAAGDVTANLDGTVFFDDARTGGSDVTANEGAANPMNQAITVNRFLDYDGNGSIDAPGVPGAVAISSFGFATSAAAEANDATQVDITFTYLGQNENFGGGDDVVIGTERVDYNHTGGGEYFVDFDTDLSAMIDGLGSRFRIVVAPVDIDGGVNESIRMKGRPAGEQSFGHQGPTMSLSGSFVAIPEPTSATLATLLASLVTARRR